MSDDGPRVLIPYLVAVKCEQCGTDHLGYKSASNGVTTAFDALRRG
jgi:hypothetical protein